MDAVRGSPKLTDADHGHGYQRGHPLGHGAQIAALARRQSVIGEDLHVIQVSRDVAQEDLHVLVL
jgi:hypothetical protein